MKSTPLYFLFIITISTTINQTLAKTNFIQKGCTTTLYSKLCYTTLSPYASEIKNNPKTLAIKALNIALAMAQSTSQTMVRLSKNQGLRTKEASALTDCTMATENSVAQLQRSIKRMRKFASQVGKARQASDVQTWTSTALTYAGTCMKNFDGDDMNGNVKGIVKGQIERLTQYTSIALALVNNNYDVGTKPHLGSDHP